MKDVLKKIKDYVFSLNNKYESFITKKPFFYVTQFFPKNILLFILFIVVLFITFTRVKTNDVLMIGTNYNSFADEITDRSLIQEINTKNVNRFNKIGIIFGTYARKNTSNYKFILYKNGQVINTKAFNSSDVEDVKTHFFNYKTIKVNKNDKYKFEIKPINAKKGNALTVTIDDKTNRIHYELRAESEFKIYVCVIIFLSLFLIVNYLINNNIVRKNSSFYMLMLIYIIPTLLLIPAFQVPDEINHFSKAYSMSQYDFKKTPYNNSKKKLNMPYNSDCLYYSKRIEKTFYSDNVSNKKLLINCFKDKKNKMKTSFYDINYSRFVSFLAPALGIKLIDYVSNAPLLIFYVGRLFNFIVSFFIILYAIKKANRFKNLLLLVAMIPMLVYQLVSYSYDSILNALLILVCSFLINFFTDSHKIRKKDLIIFLLSSVLIYNIKAPYILIPLTIILVDGKKFSDKKYYKYLLIAFAFLIIFGFNKLLNFLPNIGFISANEMVEKASGKTSADNLSLLINHPINILRVAKHTIESRGTWYLSTMIGSLGWLRYIFDSIIVYSYFFVLIFCFLSSEKINISNKRKMLGLFMQLILVGGIFLSLYITWSPYGLNYVEGVQGRYFLPLIIPIFLMLFPKKKVISIEDSFIMSFINIIQLYSILMILICFY